jgi:hypothetical protein
VDTLVVVELARLVFLALGTVVGIPVVTLVHEIGHGVAAAFAVGGRVRIQQGPEPRRLRASVWRLDLELRGVVAPHRGWIGWALWSDAQSPRRAAVAFAGGPIASALCVLGCLAAATAATGVVHVLLLVLAIDSACQLVSTSLPVRYPSFAGTYAGHTSDGLAIKRLLAASARANA